MPYISFERNEDADVGIMWSDFITAVGVFVGTNGGKSTVKNIAMSFNTTPELVREAIDAHYWLVASADGTVFADGD